MREHGTKTTPVFLPADGEASWSLLPSSVSLLSCGTVEPENTYSCILKVTDQVWESQKRTNITLITATTSVHLPKPVSTDLTIKPHAFIEITNFPLYRKATIMRTCACLTLYLLDLVLVRWAHSLKRGACKER